MGSSKPPRKCRRGCSQRPGTCAEPGKGKVRVHLRPCWQGQGSPRPCPSRTLLSCWPRSVALCGGSKGPPAGAAAQTQSPQAWLKAARPGRTRSEHGSPRPAPHAVLRTSSLCWGPGAQGPRLSDSVICSRSDTEEVGSSPWGQVDGRSLRNAARRTDPPLDSGPLRLGVGLRDRTVSGSLRR